MLSVLVSQCPAGVVRWSNETICLLSSCLLTVSPNSYPFKFYLNLGSKGCGRIGTRFWDEIV